MTERVGRWSRGLASLALLVGLVVGVPTALFLLGGDPVPVRWDPAGLWAALLRPDDGTVLARLLALVGWLAWVVFTTSLLVELVNLVRRRSSDVVLPGLSGVQQWAAGLMLAVVALGGAAQLTSGPTTPTAVAAGSVPGPDRTAAAPRTPEVMVPGRAETAAATPAPTVADPGEPVSPAAPSGRRERIHVVRTGDDLWSLAEQYYGRGQEWRRIATANPHLLTGGPDRLEVGWRLVVPDDGRAEPDGGTGSEDGQRTVRVRSGDTLTSVAERALGDADRWTELYRANRDQLSDPDDLPVGLTLRLPGGSPAERATTRDQDPHRTVGSAAPEPAAEPEPEPDPQASATPPSVAPEASTAPTGPQPPPPPPDPTEAAAPAQPVVDEDGADLLL
ncbi:MAG: LysM peptidoglycan-binding domain-containing protein, partial [Janthinobacterium lividum]